jgi:hypothetical protein
MLEYTILEDYRRKYHNALNLRPLRITAKLLTPIAGYDPVHLDGLLAWAVVREATHGAGLPPSAAPYVIPLPLKCLWRDANGLPLWASTDFEPAGETLRQTLYWHKRAPRPELTHGRRGKPWNVRLTQGRYKEYRIPVPGISCAAWYADCIGDPHEVARLLLIVSSHIGKKRGQGWGAIEAWGIEECESFSLLNEAHHPRRPLPIVALTAILPEIPLDIKFGNLRGWTPPYWLPACQAGCL